MISAIVAVDRNYGIGFENKLPWPYLKYDMMHFKKLTLDHVVIMGRQTWDSIPIRPLSKRVNMVISNSLNTEYATVARSPDEAINICNRSYPGKHIFIIGGQSIYEHFLPKIKRFFVTEIDQDYQCDKFFPFNHIKHNLKTMIEHYKYTDPVTYSIKEYQV